MKLPIAIALTMLVAAAAAGCDDEETTDTTASQSASSTGSSATSGSGGASSTSSASSGASTSASSGGNGGSGGTTMGASQACQMCVARLYGSDLACQAAIQACDADAACNDWKDCSEACFTDDDTVGCYDACDQSFPHDETLSGALLTCTCDACATVCPASCS